MNDKTPRKNVSLALSGLLVTLSLLVTGCPYGGLPGGGGDGDTTSKLQDARIGLTIAGSTTTGNFRV